MKYRLNRLLNKLGHWLIMKTHIMTATEASFMEESKRLIDMKCRKCGTRVFPVLGEQFTHPEKKEEKLKVK